MHPTHTIRNSWDSETPRTAKPPAEPAGGEFDLVSLFTWMLLAVVGVAFIYSATAYGHSGSWLSSFWFKQSAFIVLGLVVYLTISMIDYKVWLENSHYLYIIALVPLLMLCLSQYTPLNLLGVSRYGSWRWLDLKVMLYQPSEGAKIATTIMIASILARSEIGSMRDCVVALVKVFIAFLIPILLIFSQPDLGSALVFVPMVFSLLFVSKLSDRFFYAVFGLCALGLAVVSFDLYGYVKYLESNNLSAQHDTGIYEEVSIVPLRDYQRNRILDFVAPEVVDPKGIGVSWNSNQSKISVATGGLAGKGHGQGTQAKLGYLPQSVAHNDFIFSVLAEEVGFLGSSLVLAAFALLLANGVRVASMARDRFGMLLAIGVSAIFAVHIFVNVGMTIGLMPITGLPLPFLSYGGSFLLSCCILQGLVQSVYRFRRAYA